VVWLYPQARGFTHSTHSVTLTVTELQFHLPSGEVEVEVNLRLTVSQSVYLGIEHPYGICDQILLPVGMLLSEICGFVSMGRPLWWEDVSAICSVITQWSESRRTHNHTLLSHLRFPQPGGPGSRIYIPQELGCPVIGPGIGLPLRCLLRLSGLRKRFLTHHGPVQGQSQKSKSRYDWWPVNQYVLLSNRYLATATLQTPIRCLCLGRRLATDLRATLSYLPKDGTKPIYNTFTTSV
jgi:hypothetical protein